MSQSPTHVEPNAAKAEARLVARAGHDMRQPLHALTLFLAALRRRAQDEQTHTIVTRAEQAGAALSRVILGLLALAQLNAADGQEPLQAVALDELFAELKEELAGDFAITGAALATDGAGQVLTDPEMLKSILRQLLYFAGHAGGEVRLSGRAGPTGAAVELSCPGALAEDVAALLASDFERAAATPRSARDGMDLALLVAGRQAQALGVTIDAVAEGERTTLRIALASAPS